jgi:hypothetical protein
MEIIQNNIKSPLEKVEWKIKQVELIINPELEENFKIKIKELKLMVREHSLLLNIINNNYILLFRALKTINWKLNVFLQKRIKWILTK